MFGVFVESCVWLFLLDFPIISFINAEIKDMFLYKYFRYCISFTNDLSVQLVKNTTYDNTANSIFKSKPKFIADLLTCYKKIPTLFPQGFNDNF